MVKLLLVVFWVLTCTALCGPSADEVQAAAAKHVIHISVDGLGSDMLQQTLARSDANELPNFRRLMSEGTSTFQARTDTDYTITLPNHISMLVGRPVLPDSEQPHIPSHGITTNGIPAKSWTIHNRSSTRSSYVASVFDIVHDHGLSTGLFASKKKFVIFDQSYNKNTGAKDTIGTDNGQDKIDFFSYSNGSSSKKVQREFLKTMRKHPLNYVFLHYCEPDKAGHTHGWGHFDYLQSLKTVDKYLGQIFELIASQPELNHQTAIVLTSDHGGSRLTHLNARLAKNFTIPVMAWGAGIGENCDLYELNSMTRAQPHDDLNPPYVDWPQPIRNGDTGNLALSLLGLPAIPGSFINAQQDLSTFTAPITQETHR